MTYVIWSFEHRQWWRANRSGYAPELSEAGRYDALAAGNIVANAYLGEHVMLHEATAARFGAPTVPNLWAILRPSSDAEPSSRCSFRSSVTDATCVLPAGHPADSPFRFHRFTP